MAITAGASGGNSSTFSFDGNSTRVKSMTNGLGATTTFSYDASGGLTAIREPGGALTRIGRAGANTYSIADSTGAKVQLATDAAGNLTRLTDPLGRQLRLSWDADGRLLSVDDPVNGLYRYTYDAAGQLISRLDAGGALTRYGYDADGNLTSVTDALGHVWRFGYNSRDLPVLLTDPLGHSEHLVYDAAGRRVAVIDANGHRTDLQYDAAGRVSTTIDAYGHATQYLYDSTDQLLETIAPSGAATYYTYDATGNVVTSTAPAGVKTGRLYDKVGEITSLKRADGVTTSYHYDLEGRLTARLGSDGSGASMRYDTGGRLTAATSGKLSVRYMYDAAGDITREVDAAGHTTLYGYDGQGRRVTMTDPAGHVTRYRYDAAGRLRAIDDPSGSSTFSYDALGRRITATLPGGIQATYAYDADNRETSIVYRRGGKVLLQLSYRYDAVGNVIREATAGKVTRYQYDAVDRLVAASGNGGTRAYRYDAVGNLVDSPAGNNWQYDAAGQLVSANGVRYTYDAAGNLATASDGTRYHFDALGDLLGVSGPKGTVTYTYDPLGRLLTRTSGKTTMTYAYDGGTPLATFTGTHETRLLNGPGVNEVLASSSPSVTTYLRDLRGSVAGWVTQGGRSTNVSYSPYGLSQSKQQAPGDLGFAGQTRDPITGLVTLGNRHYDPTHGRFISPDPIAANGAPLYLYASDNPTSRIDPLGLCDGGPSSDDYFTKGGEATAVDGVLASLAGVDAVGTQLGVLGVAMAFAQAINCPSAANAVGLFGTTGLFALALLMPELGLVLAVVGVGFALLNERAGQKYPGYSDCGPGGPKIGGPGEGDGGGDCDPNSNTDPTFIDPTEHLGAGHDATQPLARGSATIVLPVGTSGTASVAVYDASGTLVRSLGAAIAVAPPTTTVTWDGTDARGRHAAPGRYYAVTDLRSGDNPLADHYGLQTINLAAAARAVVTPPAVPMAAQQQSGLLAGITLPSDNAMVRGVVPINGYAAGSDFDHYEVDYGQGNSPKSWTSLTSRNTPTNPSSPLPLYHKKTLSGNLASLDTGLSIYHYDFRPTLSGDGLGGTYTVRLQVFGRHGEVAEARVHLLVARAVPYVTDSLAQSPDTGATLAVPSLSIHSLAQLFALEPVNDAPALPAGVSSAGAVYALHPAGYAFSAAVTLQLKLARAAKNVEVYTWVADRHQWQLVPSQRSADGAALVSTMTSIGADPALYTVVKVSGSPGAPVLFDPAGTTTSLATTSLAGLALPGSRVSIRVAGRPAVLTTAGNDGLFTDTSVALHPGANTIRAAAVGPSGQTSLLSAPVRITFSPPHVTIVGLKASGPAATANSPLRPGDRIAIEAQIAATSNPPDGFMVLVSSGARPAGIEIPVRHAGGLSYRGVLAVGAAAPPDASPAQAALLGPVPVLPASGRGDTVRITAGGRAATLKYQDMTGPIAPVIASSSHPAAIASDFARPDGIWPADPAPLGALVERVAVNGTPGGFAERVTAGPTSEMFARVPLGSFDLAAHPIIDFSYNVPPSVAVDLGIHANGVWWMFGLSDTPPSTYDSSQTFFAPIWSHFTQIVRDGRWHQETINLYQALRDEIPAGPIMVDRVLFGDWESASWMAVQPSHTNAPGASFLLGSVSLPAVTPQPFVRFSWNDADPSGVAGYSYVLDQKPSTVPPARSMGRVTQARFGPLQSGAWWLHVRAVEGKPLG